MVLVDSSSIIKAPASAWSFRIGWAPVAQAADSQSTIIRYQVQLTCVETGKRHAFYTPDDLPSIVLSNREVREKVGDAFIAQIRVLRSDNVGDWSEASEKFSVAKSAPNRSLALGTPLASAFPQPSLAPRKKPALAAFPYTDTKKALVKKREEDCGGVTKRQRSASFHRAVEKVVKERMVKSEDAAGIWDFFTPKFRRPIAKNTGISIQ